MVARYGWLARVVVISAKQLACMLWVNVALGCRMGKGNTGCKLGRNTGGVSWVTGTFQPYIQGFGT